MIKNISNSRTTFAGGVAILAAIAQAYASGDYGQLAQAIAGFGLILAADAK